MFVLLHEGHGHTETGVTVTSPELFVAAALGILLVGAVLAYTIRRYAGD